MVSGFSVFLIILELFIVDREPWMGVISLYSAQNWIFNSSLFFYSSKLQSHQLSLNMF